MQNDAGSNQSHQPPYSTYKELVLAQCKSQPEVIAFEWVEDGLVLQKTYGEFLDEVFALGTALRKKGFGKAHVGILGKNSYAWVLLYSALLFGETVAVPLSTAASPDIVLEQIHHSDTALLVHDEAYSPLANRAEGVQALCFSELPALLQEGRQLLAQGDTAFCEYVPLPEETAFILFTSGTTGSPKGVVVSNRTGAWEGFRISRFFPLRGKAVLNLPLYHVGDLMFGLCAYIYLGNTIVINKEPKNLFSDMRLTKPNVMGMVPMTVEGAYKRIADMNDEEAKAFFGGELRLIASGGAAIDHMCRKRLERLGITVLYFYGMTELCVVLSGETPEYRRLGSVGKPFTSLDVRIDSPDAEGRGEIVVKKDYLMDGYYKNPEETAKALRDGWFHTGDIGYFDEDGFLYVTGRLKNVIILSNGENVVPEELETQLMQSAYIRECIVYQSDRAIAADIYPDFAYAAAQNLSGKALHDKIQDEVDSLNKTLALSRHIQSITVFEQPLPRTASGKLKRAV